MLHWLYNSAFGHNVVYFERFSLARPLIRCLVLASQCFETHDTLSPERYNNVTAASVVNYRRPGAFLTLSRHSSKSAGDLHRGSLLTVFQPFHLHRRHPSTDGKRWMENIPSRRRHVLSLDQCGRQCSGDNYCKRKGIIEMGTHIVKTTV